MQSLALLITAALLVPLTLVFLWVLFNTEGKVPLEQVATPAYRARAVLFALTVLAGVAITTATLAPWPHDAQAAPGSARSISAKARQWAWELSSHQANVGEVVEFVVTSEDVNHGFALYDPQNLIVAQVQAMPGFVNTVRYRFERPGQYEVLCLEFCGLAHHGMTAQIQVLAQP